MPDTYISQFSGEEIDAALRAAQIISGASTPAELRKKLEIRGDTIPVSATDPTPISEALTTSGGGINPNLLDNWYFGNPVNQRSGYYIPAGVKYNTLSWTEVGTTDKAYPVIGYIGQDPLITVNGTNYIVGKSVQVPGYCAAGYTVDRWYSLATATSKTVKVESDGFVISDTADFGAFIQRIEYQGLLGKTVTFSVLAKCLAQGAQSPYITVMNGSGSDYSYEGYDMIKAADNYEISSVTVTLSNTAPTGGYFFVDCVGMTGSSIKILAAKLELGDTQTLAHKENGVWVLNEIPDFGEQLRRCMYYAEKVESKDTPAITNSTFVPSGATSAVFILPYARKRTVPAIKFNDVSNYRIIARLCSGETTAFSVTAISHLDVGRTKAAILVSFNATDQDYYCFLQRSDNAPAGYAFISADL